MKAGPMNKKIQLIQNVCLENELFIIPESSKHRHTKRLTLTKITSVLIVASLMAVTLPNSVAAATTIQQNNLIPVTLKDGVSFTSQIHSIPYIPGEGEDTDTAEPEALSPEVTALLEFAAAQLGKPYVFGKTGPKSFDCSGLVYYCLNMAGVSVYRNTAYGYSRIKVWEKITSMDDLQPGDLLFFSVGGKKIGHTGIYIGDGNMIDASSSSGKVVQRSCVTSYWIKHFVVARRAL